MTPRKMAQMNRVMRSVFKAVTEEDILRNVNNHIVYKGQPITPEFAKELSAEAQMIMNTNLWKMLTDEMVYEAQQIMFERASSTDDMFFGKAIIWSIDVMKRKLMNLAKLLK